MPEHPPFATETAIRWKPAKHAEERMRERNITESEIGAVLSQPDVTTPAKQGRTHYWRTVNGRRLRITAATADSAKEPGFDLVVITAAEVNEDGNAARAKGD